MAKRDLPEINSSSMADIAFLLLTFFLIASSMDKPEGIFRKIPNPDQVPENPPIINDRNLLTILVNFQGQIQIEGENAQLSQITDEVIKHVDNGGGKNAAGEVCDYCEGVRDPSSSDHPNSAVVSIELDKGTPYEYYIAAQGLIDKGYKKLWDRYAEKKFGKSYDQLKSEANMANDTPLKIESQKQLDEVESAYPKIIAEAKPLENL